jgi:hypothetical protein
MNAILTAESATGKASALAASTEETKAYFMAAKGRKIGWLVYE